jgi:hypothetical protein
MGAADDLLSFFVIGRCGDYSGKPYAAAIEKNNSGEQQWQQWQQ